MPPCTHVCLIKNSTFVSLYTVPSFSNNNILIMVYDGLKNQCQELYQSCFEDDIIMYPPMRPQAQPLPSRATWGGGMSIFHGIYIHIHRYRLALLIWFLFTEVVFFKKNTSFSGQQQRNFKCVNVKKISYMQQNFMYFFD